METIPRFSRHADLSGILGQDYFLCQGADPATLAADVRALPGPCIVDLRLLGEDRRAEKKLARMGFEKICTLVVFHLDLAGRKVEAALTPESSLAPDAAFIERHARNLRLGCFSLNRHIAEDSWMAVHRGLVGKSLASPAVLKFVQDGGFLSFTIQGDDAVVDFLSVPERRRGIGSALMARLIGWAVSRNLARIEVATEIENVPACRFYEKNGFSRTRLIAIHHLVKN